MVWKYIEKKRVDVGFRCREEIVMKALRGRNSTLVILIINGVNIRVAGYSGGIINVLRSSIENRKTQN